MITLDIIKAATAQARANGALFSISTEHLTIVDHGLEFLVRKATQLARKERTAPKDDVFINPFHPPDTLMVVGDISQTHMCLLNKYNVVDFHLLACTKAFEHQSVRLNGRDFEAWWACITALGDGIGFYNCGPESGASQPHKHMQVVPGPSPFLERLLDGIAADWSRPHISPFLPFAHVFIKFPAFPDPGQLESAYLVCAQALEMSLVDAHPPALLAQNPLLYPPDFASYNALLTRSMLLLVPRAAECTFPSSDGVSVAINGLAFAGYILTKNDNELALVRTQGPMQILQQLAVPRV